MQLDKSFLVAFRENINNYVRYDINKEHPFFFLNVCFFNLIALFLDEFAAANQSCLLPHDVMKVMKLYFVSCCCCCRIRLSEIVH